MLKHFARLTSACLLLAALLHSAQGSRSNGHPLRGLADVSRGGQTPPLVMFVSAPQTHTVQAGETLWGISQRYGIDYKRLASMNERLGDATEAREKYDIFANINGGHLLWESNSTQGNGTFRLP